jgi:hypothetical protein|nr:MAG TPA: hypothetical protein [Caudoviricetes sp.]
MLAYYGYTISPNQIETGEGFLICKNVPIARTGTQDYLGSELGLSGGDSGRIIAVIRSPDEVFSEAALASFEGKPVTNDHPPGLIGPDEVKTYEMGHAQNIRRGTGEWKDYMIADLHIHDRDLIDAIQNGKREISCGYECDYIKNEDGTYSQKNIRGNHVAVVDRGRAGKRAAILDSDKNEAKKPERKAMSKTGLFFKLFGQAVKDKSPEEIEQMAMDAAVALDAEETKGQEENNLEEKKSPEDKPDGVGETATKDSEFLNALDKKIDRLLEFLDPTTKKEEKDPMDEAIESLEGGKDEDPKGDDQENGEAKVVPVGEMDEETNEGMDKAIALGILKAMRPTVAAIQDSAQRKAVSDALIKLVTTKDANSDISAILKASQANAKKTADKASVMNVEQCQAAYDARNPHKRKENE